MVVNHYYNIFRKSDDEFLGTVAVPYNREDETDETPVPPSTRACVIAEAKLVTEHSTGAVGVYAVMSTKEQHLLYGLN